LGQIFSITNMNHHKITLILLYFLGLNLIQAQEATLKVGPNLNKAISFIDIKLNDNNLSLLSSSRSEELNSWQISPISLIPNSESRSITKSGKSDNKNVLNSNEYKFFRYVDLGDRELVFYTRNEGKDKTTQLYYQNLDQSFIPIGKPSKLASRSTKGVKTGLFKMNTLDRGGYTIKLSQNGDQLLIINQAPEKKINKETVPGEISCTLYNTADLSEISSASFNLNIANYGGGAILGENGYVYSLVLVTAETKSERKEKAKNGEASWYYKIVGVNVNEPDKPPFEHDLTFKNKGILKASLEISNTGELICAGTYSELTKKGKIDDFDGIFYAKLNPQTGEVISDNQRKLDRATVQFYTSAKNSQKDEGVNKEFKIRGFLALPNNTSMLILEEDYMYVTSYTNSQGQTRTTYHYISKAIMVANIASDGEINWISHIPKHQHSINDNGMVNSFSYFIDKDKIKFLFSDAESNYDPKTLKLKAQNAKSINSMNVASGGSAMALAELDFKGKVTQNLILKSSKNIMVARYAAWTTSGKEIYLETSKKIPMGKILLGCLFPPYGCYLYLKSKNWGFCIGRIELAD
jgi:hypothetical protein